MGMSRVGAPCEAQKTQKFQIYAQDFFTENTIAQ